MKKHIKKIIIMGVALIMCLGIFTACSSGIKFNIGYDQMGAFGSKEFEDGETMNTLELVTSVQKLQALCDEWGNPAFQESSEHYSSELSQKIRTYNDAFFSDKILVIYSFDRGHNKETRIDSIEVDGAKLIINARYKTKRGTFTSEAFNWLILIEVNKVDVAGTTTVQVKYK